MRNVKTKRVFDYWTSLRDGRPAPHRRDVSPRDLKGLLPFVFLAERMGPGLTVFRLAGTGLCERYGRELRDHNLDALWSAPDRPTLRHFIDRVLETPAPGLAVFRAETIDRRTVSGEMLLLPLSDGEGPGTMTRLLGCAFATQSTSWLGQRPLVHQFLEGTRLLATPGETHLNAAVGTAPLANGVEAGEPPIAAPPGWRTASEDLPVVRQRKHLRLVVSQDAPPPIAPHQKSQSSIG